MSDEIAKARAAEGEKYYTLRDLGNGAFLEEEHFRSSVTGKNGNLGKKAKRKLSLKKHAPLIFIISLLLGGIALIFVSQSFMPFALVNRFIEEYNGSGISSILRSDSLLDTQLSSTGSYFGLSENQRAAFKESGIYPVDFVAGGTNNTALVYRESDGTYRAVVPKSLASEENLNALISQNLGNGQITLEGSPLSAEDALKLPSFKDQYATASKTWRGGNAGWYDSIEDLTEARLAIRRTRFNGWTSAALTSATESWKKLASGNSTASDGGLSDYGSYVDTDSDGNETTTTNSGSVDASSFSGATTMDKVRDVLNSKITSAAKLAATVGCTGVEIMMAIQTYMSAQQSLQYLNLATGYFEAVQSAQVGKNNGEPMNEYNKILTTPDPETGKTPMEAASSSELFSGTKVSQDDESVKTVSFENLMSSLGTLTGNVNMTAQAFEACSYIKMGVAATNFASTVISFIPVLGQAAKAIHIVARLVSRIAIGVAISSVTAFIVPQILTQVFKNVAKNVATEWTGTDYFEAMSSGASKYIGGNFQTGGGSAASKTSLASYNRVKEEVLVAEADTERRSKSPFDLTSRNTFLGSIVYNLIPLATTSTVGGVVRNLSSVFSGSVTKLLPSASAVAETNLASSLGSCPVMESVGAVCDARGNRIDIDDPSLASMSNDELRAKLLEADPDAFKGKDANGRDIINPDSITGKTAAILNQRVATLGVADASAANRLVEQPSSLVSNLPLVGDVAQIVTAMGEAENIAWISGAAGVDSPENPLWEKVRYAQEYIKRERWAEVAGLTEKSSVSAFLEDYYKENPLDNSREGILARYSGMTKEEVLAVEDTIDVLVYLANYDPATRLDFSQNQTAYVIIDSCPNKSCETPKLLPKNPEEIAPTGLLTKLAPQRGAATTPKNLVFVATFPAVASVKMRREISKAA